MAIAVDVFIKDTETIPQPISGVVVNVYNSTTLAFITTGTSDSLGQASFLLPGTVGGTVYELRFFKSGVVFDNPKSILVFEPIVVPSTNQFDISGTVVTLPVATDPLLCRCTGQFVGLNGAPVPNTLVRVLAILGSGNLTKPPDSPMAPPPLVATLPPLPNLLSGFQVPKVIGGKMVSSDTMEVRTDINGRVSFDLIRNGQYNVSFAGEEDVVWCIIVPDRSSANFIDLIHPAPSSLAWDGTDAPGNVVTVAVGATATVKFGAVFTNFQTYSKNLANILQFTNLDGAVADVVYDSGNGQLLITGRVAGSTSVTVAVLPNMTPARIPDYSITAATLAVTVTP